jgi:hypothetical protein
MDIFAISSFTILEEMASERFCAYIVTPPLWRDLVKISTRKLWHTSSFSLERTDFKNLIFEKIP